MGKIQNRDLASQGEDIELIRDDASPNYWGGDIGSSVVRPINGFQAPYAGMQVINNGAYSGAVTSTIDSVDVCISVTLENGNSRFECDLAHSVSPSGDIANQAGDSGGPVSHNAGGNFYALGVVSASSTNKKVACVYNSTTCYTDLYFTEMYRAIDYWGATLMTQ